MRQGMSPRGARLRAVRNFGPMEKHKAETREARGTIWFEELAQDVRYSVRTFIKNPGFAAIAVLTLALGIGANTAIFSVINAAFFAPYAVQAPERLVRLWGQDLKRNIAQLSFSVPKYELLRDQQTSFASFGAMTNLAQTLIVGNEPVQVNGAFSTSTFLETFGATPIAGRFFRADEERGANVAVLGEDIWRARFAADPAVVGRAITLDGGHLHRRSASPRGCPRSGMRMSGPRIRFSIPGLRRHHSSRLQLSAAGRPLEAGRRAMSRLVASSKCWPRDLPRRIRAMPTPRGR